MNRDPLVWAILGTGLLFLSLTFTGMAGRHEGEERVRKEAVSAGMAEYLEITEGGRERRFRWRTELLRNEKEAGR